MIFCYLCTGTRHHTSGNQKISWGPYYLNTEQCKYLHTWLLFTPTGRHDAQTFKLKVCLFTYVEKSFLINLFTLQMGMNKFKHYHRGSVMGNGFCEGQEFSLAGVSYSSYIVTQYYTVTLEEFSVKTVDGVSFLPFDKSSTHQCAWDPDVGAYYSSDKIVSMFYVFQKFMLGLLPWPLMSSRQQPASRPHFLCKVVLEFCI